MIRSKHIAQHPAKSVLLAYAETRAAGISTVSAELGAHLASCAACRGEVAAMALSLTACERAVPLKSTTQARARILLQAREMRQEPVRSLGRQVRQIGRLVLYAAATLVIAFHVYWVALIAMEQRSAPARQETAQRIEDPAASGLLLQNANTTIKSLAAAVQGVAEQSQSLQDKQQWRAITAIDTDIAAARKALEVNPSCLRATHIINANLQRQAQALRHFYLERTL